jgi:hypothetical protein
MTKLACVAVLAASLAGCAYPKVAMVEVVNAPPAPPHPVAPPPCPDARPDDYDARAFAGDLLGMLAEVAADCVGSQASHRR